MGEPTHIGGNGSLSGLPARSPRVEAGQRRVDRTYPHLPILIVEQVEDRWRIEYATGGGAILPDNVIRHLYPELEDDGRAA